MYNKNFEAKQITGQKLLLFEQSDLIDLGVGRLDHRITIFNAIRSLTQLVNFFTFIC
jgi:hypothetical protein